MSLIGLDIGTTGCKAIVFSTAGEILGQAAREYPILTPHPNWAEQDAELVWKLAWESLSEAVAQVEDDPPVAMALSCQGEAVMPVDADGNPMRMVILGMDTRTTAENEWLAERFGADWLFECTGMPLHTVNTLPKLLWLKEHEPDLWRAADRFLLYEDFFIHRFTGKAVIGHCLASRTQMYDQRACDWSDEILDACGIERERLAPLAEREMAVVGVMKPDLAAMLGVAGEILLVSGGHDQACAACGSGVIEPGLAMVSTGTAEVVEVVMDSPALDPALRDGGISVYRHVVPGMYLAMALNHSGGLTLRWFRDTIGALELEQARASGQDAYDLLLADAPSEPTPMFVLPHFAGAGTPIQDTASKGAFVGMTFATDRPMMAKAVLEGLTFELRTNLDLLREVGIELGELRAVGGGARSDLWLQLKADICNISLRVPQVTEAACLGAALLAGTAAGVYPDLPTAVAQTVRVPTLIQPDPVARSDYEQRYALYLEIYPALRDLQTRL